MASRMSEDLSGAFQTRHGVPSPHCFMVMNGNKLLAPYKSLMEEQVQAEGVYICVKAFVRDTCLQQAPVLALPPGRGARIAGSQPREVHARKELSEDQIKSFLRLATLCQKKYNLPQAGDALKAVVYSRSYECVQFQWLERQQGRANSQGPVLPSSNAYFPHLPDRTWELVAQIH